MEIFGILLLITAALVFISGCACGAVEIMSDDSEDDIGYYN